MEFQLELQTNSSRDPLAFGPRSEVLRCLVFILFTALLYAGLATPSSASPKDAAMIPLISFQSPDEARAWRTVNDNVMGGRSQGGSVIEDGQLVFAGVINTNGGGFSSVRREMQPGALEGTQGLVLSVKSDGRGYRLIAQTSARFRGRYVSYQAPIPVTPKGEWTAVRVAFSDFVPSVFGRTVPASVFSPEELTELGFIIADDVDGGFALSVRSVSIES